jgi:hypothetical protein
MDNPGKLAAYGIQDEEKKGQNPISLLFKLNVKVP